MTPKQEKELNQAIRERLEKCHRDGLAQGMAAMAKVVYDKANSQNKTDAEKLREIIKLCETSLRGTGVI